MRFTRGMRGIFKETRSAALGNAARIRGSEYLCGGTNAINDNTPMAREYCYGVFGAKCKWQLSRARISVVFDFTRRYCSRLISASLVGAWFAILNQKERIFAARSSRPGDFEHFWKTRTRGGGEKNQQASKQTARRIVETFSLFSAKQPPSTRLWVYLFCQQWRVPQRSSTRTINFQGIRGKRDRAKKSRPRGKRENERKKKKDSPRYRTPLPGRRRCKIRGDTFYSPIFLTRRDFTVTRSRPSVGLARTFCVFRIREPSGLQWRSTPWVTPGIQRSAG